MTTTTDSAEFLVELDRGRRDGGWGAISRQVARSHPGRWTARSWRPVDGLLRSL